jgi:hypothetical protein
MILDADRSRGPALNSITAFAGLTTGSLGAAALVSYAPDPQQLVEGYLSFSLPAIFAGVLAPTTGLPIAL